MRSFKHVAQLVRSKRVTHPKHYSQFELSELLGYKNGQFISNVERALCNIPLKMMSKLCRILDIEYQDLKEACLKDYRETLDHYFQHADKESQHLQNNQDVIIPRQASNQ